MHVEENKSLRKKCVDFQLASFLVFFFLSSSHFDVGLVWTCGTMGQTRQLRNKPTYVFKYLVNDKRRLCRSVRKGLGKFIWTLVSHIEKIKWISPLPPTEKSFP